MTALTLVERDNLETMVCRAEAADEFGRAVVRNALAGWSDELLRDRACRATLAVQEERARTRSLRLR